MYQDDDPIETSEWLDALESLIEQEGVDRAKYILERLSERASRDGTELPYSITAVRRSVPERAKNSAFLPRLPFLVTQYLIRL